MRRPLESEGKVFINAEPAALILDLAKCGLWDALAGSCTGLLKIRYGGRTGKRADAICRDRSYARPGHHSKNFGKAAR